MLIYTHTCMNAYVSTYGWQGFLFFQLLHFFHIWLRQQVCHCLCEASTAGIKYLNSCASVCVCVFDFFFFLTFPISADDPCEAAFLVLVYWFFNSHFSIYLHYTVSLTSLPLPLPLPRFCWCFLLSANSILLSTLTVQTNTTTPPRTHTSMCNAHFRAPIEKCLLPGFLVSLP